MVLLSKKSTPGFIVLKNVMKITTSKKTMLNSERIIEES